MLSVYVDWELKCINFKVCCTRTLFWELKCINFKVCCTRTLFEMQQERTDFGQKLFSACGIEVLHVFLR